MRFKGFSNGVSGQVKAQEHQEPRYKCFGAYPAGSTPSYEEHRLSPAIV
jgi:hypothetical protein